ncbi:hypothetical protein EPA93_10890 [Ktedonosporobacter rubrisoli]|uniref:Lipoprotein n=1 Tax=Ktedonosporobacter rubrisoli TaxID=2509675 RepID=A0A4P6JMI5_KTERU|nr:hypothetical protein [Ktedonosporobacter rubrisoli]QBD76487.1 hypothetical protein EPA93_10890 [Ktedonosporobacter rubrisoli]
MRVGKHLLLILSMALLVVGCGSTEQAHAQSQAQHNNSLTKLQIKLFGPGETAPLKRVVINDQELIQKLYAQAQALPKPQKDRICTMQLGLSYALSFWNGDKLVEMMVANSSGCGDLMLSSGDWRQPDRQFWQVLRQAYDSAAGVKQPDSLAVVRYTDKTQPPLYARVTSASQVQKFLTALHQLPRQADQCAPVGMPFDDLYFFEGEKMLRVQIFKGACKAVRIMSEEGWRTMDQTVEQLLEQTLATTSFAKAIPDRLEMRIAFTKHGQDNGLTFMDLGHNNEELQRVRKIYDVTYALPLLPLRNGNHESCPASGSLKYYMLIFSQGGAWLTTAIAYENCEPVQLNTVGATGIPLRQATQEFWSLVRPIGVQ